MKKVFTLQVDEGMLARWKERASARSMSVAALVIEAMAGGSDAPRQSRSARVSDDDRVVVPDEELIPIPVVPIGIPPGLTHPRLGSSYAGGHPVGPILPPRVTGAAGDATGYRPKRSWRTTDK